MEVFQFFTYMCFVVRTSSDLGVFGDGDIIFHSSACHRRIRMSENFNKFTVVKMKRTSRNIFMCDLVERFHRQGVSTDYHYFYYSYCCDVLEILNGCRVTM